MSIVTSIAPLPEATDRFSAPLYTQREAARFLGVPQSTFNHWVKGYANVGRGGRPVLGEPIVTSTKPSHVREASIPFIGLAEAYVLAALRQLGVPLQRIRPALEALDRELGLEHALASRRLLTDGAEVLYDYSHKTGDTGVSENLVVLRSGQRVFASVIRDYLQRVDFASDGYAERFPLPAYERAHLIVDPRRSFGQPIFASGGGRLEDVLSMFKGGESIEVVAEEFGMPEVELEAALRVELAA